MQSVELMDALSEIERLREENNTLKGHGCPPSQSNQSRQSHESMCSRESARTLLDRVVEKLRQKADRLERLGKAMPLVLEANADEALYQLLMPIRLIDG